MFETATEEIAERIKVLRRQAAMHREDAERATQNLKAQEAAALAADRLADDYEAILNPH